MNTALILAAGVGQRMRNGGLPKQFLKLMGKPVIIYTLEKFEQCREVDQIIVVCHGSYIEYMRELIRLYNIQKVKNIIVGGSDRQSSIQKGLETAEKNMLEEDIIIIHDGVRPLVEYSTIKENIRIAGKYGCAVTVHPVTESVIVTEKDEAGLSDVKKRTNTYSMTSPQSFQIHKIYEAYKMYEQKKTEPQEENTIPLLDAAMVYAECGNKIHLVKEQGTNIKITTPEDFYFLKAILDLEESKYIFGL